MVCYSSDRTENRCQSHNFAVDPLYCKLVCKFAEAFVLNKGLEQKQRTNVLTIEIQKNEINKNEQIKFDYEKK